MSKCPKETKSINLSKITKIWNLEVIKLLQKNGLAPKNIQAEIVAILVMMLHLYLECKK